MTGLRKGRAGSALRLVIIAVLGLVIGTEPSLAANVAVSPVNISLTRDTHSALLSVTNEGADTVRFTVTTFAWNQTDAGKMELAPTSDIIFFPTLLTIAPGEVRNVRLGTQLLPAALERSYRLFLEELPSPQTSTNSRGVQIHVLSKIGIPIFLMPDKPRTQAAITSISTHKGYALFRLENMGSVHLSPSVVSVEGRDVSNAAVFTKDVSVWYVLAGGARSLSAPIPARACARVRSINISVKIGATTVKESQSTPSGACAS